VYCKTGGRSHNASLILDANNFTKVYDITGGFTAWNSSGYPVSTPAAGYTETIGTLNGSQFAVRFPNSWNGMLFVFCRGYDPNPVLDARTSFYKASAIPTLNKGYAFAASSYGAGGYCISRAVNGTYELTRYLVDTYHITGKVFLFGSSMGGNIALLLAEKYPDLYNGVLELDGSKDAKTQYEHYATLANLSATEIRSYLNVPSITPDSMLEGLKTLATFGIRDMAIETGGTPQGKPKAYEDASPTFHANIRIPAITIHSSGDLVVPVSQTTTYQNAVTNAGSSSLYRVYLTLPVLPGLGHIDANVQAQVGTRLDELVAWANGINNSFSIMQISDLQHLAFLSPTLYNDTTSWIVNNSASYNLKMVIDTGDFVDAFKAPPLTVYNTTQIAQEWAVANAAMSKLLNAGIPYLWCAGNHDQTPFANPNGTMIGSNLTAFNTTTMRSKSYWVDDIYDAKNTAVKFTYNNYPFMIIDVECFANTSALTWMKGLLYKNTGVNTIVATHGYLDGNANYDASTPAAGVWTNNLKATLDNYPNVFLAVSGHNHGWNMTKAGNRQEILFDFQEENNLRGAAAVRIYTFNLANMQIYASTYCIDNKTWALDSLNQFSFSASTLIPLATPALSVSAFCSVTIMTGQTWYFFAHYSGGLGPYSLQWYEGNTLLIGQTSMLLPITKNAAGTYAYTCKVADTQGTTTSNTITLAVINK
jgi:pimeloyl-ACP methyl ester carboxylesterase